MYKIIIKSGASSMTLHEDNIDKVDDLFEQQCILHTKECIRFQGKSSISLQDSTGKVLKQVEINSVLKS